MFEELKFKSNNPQQEWDEFLTEFKDYNVFQSYKFGEYYKNRGVRTNVSRFILLKEGRPAVMGQCRLKVFKLFNMAFLYMNGGPLYISNDNQNLNVKNLKEFINTLVCNMKNNYKHYYFNIKLNSESRINEKLILRELGWKNPIFQRFQPYTYILNTDKNEDDIFNNFHPKWRNQLRKSEEYNHYFNVGNNVDLVDRYVSLHNAMCKLKKMRNLKLIKKDIYRLKDTMGENLQIIIGSLEKEDVTGCMILLFNKKAYYVYAASNNKGRKYYSSNSMIWYLIKYLINIGIDELDTLGVDPLKNWGGYNFKRRIGSHPFEYMGEWEYYSNSVIRLLVNCLFYLKR